MSRGRGASARARRWYDFAAMLRGGRKTTPRVVDGRVQRKNFRDLRGAWSDGPLTIEVEVPGPGYRHVVTPDDLRRFFALIPGWAELAVGLDAIVLAEGSPGRDGSCRHGVMQLHAWPDPPAVTVGARQFAEHRAVYERIGVRWRDEPRFLGAVPLVGGPAANLLAAHERIWDALGDFDLDLVDADPARPEADAWIAVDRKLGRDGPVVCDITQIDWELHVYERCFKLAFDRRTAAMYTLLHVFLRELGRHVDACASLRRTGEVYPERSALRGMDRVWAAYVAEFG